MGKVVVITGGTSGIGLALKQLYEKNGDTVLTISTSEGGEKHYCGSVCHEIKVRQIFNDIHEKYGNIDVLINNAGVGMSGITELVPTEDIQKLVDVNYYGLLYCTRSALPFMTKGGRIVNMSSAMALFPLPFRSIYGSVKAAVLNLSYSLRMELKPLGIDVVAICPGNTKTNFTTNRLKDETTTDRYGDRLKTATEKIDSAENSRMSCEEVADKIFKLITKPKTKPMYIIGGKYKFLYFLSSITPKSLLLNFTGEIYGGKMVEKKKPIKAPVGNYTEESTNESNVQSFINSSTEASVEEQKDVETNETFEATENVTTEQNAEIIESVKDSTSEIEPEQEYNASTEPIVEQNNNSVAGQNTETMVEPQTEPITETMVETQTEQNLDQEQASTDYTTTEPKVESEVGSAIDTTVDEQSSFEPEEIAKPTEEVKEPKSDTETTEESLDSTSAVELNENKITNESTSEESIEILDEEQNEKQAEYEKLFANVIDEPQENEQDKEYNEKANYYENLFGNSESDDTLQESNDENDTNEIVEENDEENVVSNTESRASDTNSKNSDIEDRNKETEPEPEVDEGDGKDKGDIMYDTIVDSNTLFGEDNPNPNAKDRVDTKPSAIGALLSKMNGLKNHIHTSDDDDNE